MKNILTLIFLFVIVKCENINDYYTVKHNVSVNISTTLQYLVTNFTTKSKFHCLLECTKLDACLLCLYSNNKSNINNCYLYSGSITLNNSSYVEKFEMHLKTTTSFNESCKYVKCNIHEALVCNNSTIRCEYVKNIATSGSNLNITSFNGTAFSGNVGIATLYADQVYYFATDYANSVIVKFNESGEAVKVVSLNVAQFLTAFNKTVYVISNKALLIMFDINLNLMKSISLSIALAIHYNVFLDRLFVMVGGGSNLVQIFDSNLNTISTIFISSTPSEVITTFNGFIYTADSSSIYERNATSGVILRTLTSPCVGDYIFGLVVDGSGQYLYVSCYSLKKVIIMNRNGTLTGRFYTTIGGPMQLTFDYYGKLVVAMQSISGIQVISVLP